MKILVPVKRVVDYTVKVRVKSDGTGVGIASAGMEDSKVIIGDNERALSWSFALEAQGLWVPAIRPPTVPLGTARLRITLSAAHAADDVGRLVAALQAAS